MSERNYQDVVALYNIIGRMKNLMQPMSEMERLMTEFADTALRVDTLQDTELLCYMIQEILPDLDVLNQVYQTLVLGESGEKFQKICKGLQMKQESLPVVSDKSIVHISSAAFKNTGDFMLAKSLRRLFEQDNPQIKWFQVPVKVVNDRLVEWMNRSKGVLLGGGGLFLKDTNPNEVSGWTWPCPVEKLAQIKVPIYVMAVGYNRFRGQEDFAPCFTESINALVEKSSFFGLRNQGSIEAVRGYLRADLRDKVQYQPCATTMLTKLYELPERKAHEPFIALNCAYDREKLRYQGKRDEVMLAIARALKIFSSDYKIKCYSHCPQDEIACRYLDAVGVPYEKIALGTEMTETEYIRAYTEPELVLAVRGHAQLIPFGCGTPVVSMITHDKLKWFLEDIGHPEWGVEVSDEHFEEKLLEKSRYMLEHREEICGQIIAAQEKLWEITQRNLKKISI